MRAAWRLARADTIEAMLFDRLTDTDGDLGLALIRDGNNTRAFETLLRYRGRRAHAAPGRRGAAATERT